MIYHIYSGTAGSAGLYIDEIYRTLEKAGLEQRAFVSYFYPFDYADRIYCKNSTVGQSKLGNRTRRVLMLFEILIGHYKVLKCAKKDRPEIINYSHTGASYAFVVKFLQHLKNVSGCKLIITCHDVHQVTNSKEENYNRKKIFNEADYLLVHTEQSRKDLISIWNVDEKKIIQHRFPIMDMTSLGYTPQGKYEKKDFLFIGHLRKDKGAEFLLKAWPVFYKNNPSAALRICGRKMPGVDFNQESLEKMNVEFNLRFIDDEDYIEYINATRYVVLPYERGTNSGIISTALSLGANVITTNLPMFRENPFVQSDNMFEYGNIKTFVEVMHRALDAESSNTIDLVIKYREQFSEEVIGMYNSLLK